MRATLVVAALPHVMAVWSSNNNHVGQVKRFLIAKGRIHYGGHLKTLLLEGLRHAGPPDEHSILTLLLQLMLNITVGDSCYRKCRKKNLCDFFFSFACTIRAISCMLGLITSSTPTNKT